MDWSVIRTHFKQTDIALTNLAQQMLAVYDPRELVTRIVRGQQVPVAQQLFSNYLFVDAGVRRDLLYSTRGVCQVLPGSVRQEEINSIRRLENDDGYIVFNKSRFRRGSRVRMLHGAMANEIGIFDGQAKQDRVYVLMSMLGSHRRVQVADRSLEAA